MPGENIIQCQHVIPDDLSFEYQGKALDLDLACGEVISIIGPQYSGKSHWLKTICGLQQQLSGSITIHGIDTLHLSAEDWAMTRIKVAYLHADTALMSAANGLDNVLAPALYHQLDKTLKNEALTEKALNLLKEIDPELNLDDLPAYISKEQRFKIAVARVLLLDPDVLVLDKPFTHFDHESKCQFQRFLANRVNNGLSLLLASDDVQYALNISDRIIFVDRESLFHFDSKQAILNCDIAVVNEYLKLQEISGLRPYEKQ
jgi:polar amino acid transport system permease protein